MRLYQASEESLLAQQIRRFLALYVTTYSSPLVSFFFLSSSFCILSTFLYLLFFTHLAVAERHAAGIIIIITITITITNTITITITNTITITFIIITVITTPVRPCSMRMRSDTRPASSATPVSLLLLYHHHYHRYYHHESRHCILVCSYGGV
jgi:hypothetical protein